MNLYRHIVTAMYQRRDKTGKFPRRLRLTPKQLTRLNTEMYVRFFAREVEIRKGILRPDLLGPIPPYKKLEAGDCFKGMRIEVRYDLVTGPPVILKGYIKGDGPKKFISERDTIK